MNPFDWSGPEFLLFYFILGVGVLIFFYGKTREQSSFGKEVDQHDPYLIAALRGGRDEAIRIALLSLIDRGIVKSDSKRKIKKDSKPKAQPKNNLEEAIYRQVPAKINEIFASGRVQEAAGQYEKELDEAGLVAGPKVKEARRGAFWGSSLLLAAIAAIKIWIALDRGRSNIWFLVIFTLLFLGVLAYLHHHRVTAAGKEFMKEMKIRFAGLKESIASTRSSTGDLLLLGAVFGLAVIPDDIYPYVHETFPNAGTTSGSGCGGTGCGGTGCGSSDGGGGGCSGCGGGCGGCG